MGNISKKIFVKPNVIYRNFQNHLHFTIFHLHTASLFFYYLIYTLQFVQLDIW